jgi:hypothetical protein
MERTWTAGLIVLATVLGAACSNGSNLDISNDTRARVFHAAPDVGTLRITVAGHTYDDRPYGTGSDYNGISDGNQELRAVTVVGGQNVMDEHQSFTKGVDYTVAVSGSGSSLKPIIVTDDNSPPTNGQARFRALNVAPDSPTMDVYLTAPDVNIVDVQPTFSSLSPGNTTSSTQVTAGSYRIRVTQSGNKSSLVDIGPITLNNGDITTVFVLASPGGGAPYSGALLTNGAK